MQAPDCKVGSTSLDETLRKHQPSGGSAAISVLGRGPHCVYLCCPHCRGSAGEELLGGPRIFSPDAMGWVHVPPLADAGAPAPCPRKGHAMAYCSATNSVYIFGGMAEGRQLLNDLWLLRMDTYEFTKVGYCWRGGCVGITQCLALPRLPSAKQDASSAGLPMARADSLDRRAPGQRDCQQGSQPEGFPRAML
jgi:hypothetical protein